MAAAASFGECRHRRGDVALLVARLGPGVTQEVGAALALEDLAQPRRRDAQLLRTLGGHEHQRRSAVTNRGRIKQADRIG